METVRNDWPAARQVTASLRVVCRYTGVVAFSFVRKTAWAWARRWSWQWRNAEGCPTRYPWRCRLHECFAFRLTPMLDEREYILWLGWLCCMLTTRTWNPHARLKPPCSE